MIRKELMYLQSLPLSVKVAKTKLRIREWVDHYGNDKVYASFSGGLGSTVLYFLLQEVSYEEGWKNSDLIPCIFVNTRNEYPEIVQHVYSLKAQHNAKYRKILGGRAYNCPQNFYDNIVIKMPKVFLRDIIKNDGYLVISKKVSRCIYDIRKFKKRNDEYSKDRIKSLLNPKNRFSVPLRWQYLIDTDLLISDKCCYRLKKSVFKEYVKETGREYPITGEQASESYLRMVSYLNAGGCNGFNRKEPKSTPLGFWTSSDLAEYLYCNHLPYAKCYGDIVVKCGKYMTTGEKRTGCICCMAGITGEEKNEENRYQRMERLYPKQYRYLMEDIEEGGLGARKVLTTLKIPYRAKEVLDTIEFIDLFNGV